jgi:endonuclease VIII
MPEGDTVWRACRRLHQALAGQVLTRSDLRVPSLATTDLAGHTVEQVAARGKHILMRLSGGLTLHSHFRMDGSWHLYRPGERWRGGPQHQVRAVLETAAWTAVGYRLPVLDLLRTADEAEVVGHLGPDLLDAGFDRAAAVANVSADPERSISEALLDQRNLAGIGNLYRVEVCFLTGTHPERPAGAVDVGRMVDLSRRLMRANLERVAQVTTGVDRPGQRTWVYDRPGKPCRRCGSRIETGSTGQPPYDRVSYWCPSCQPEP